MNYVHLAELRRVLRSVAPHGILQTLSLLRIFLLGQRAARTSTEIILTVASAGVGRPRAELFATWRLWFARFALPGAVTALRITSIPAAAYTREMLGPRRGAGLNVVSDLGAG